MNLRQALKQNAREVGFDLVGIAPVTPGRDLPFAREWLDRGYGGEMSYLSNPKRFDPRTVMPSVKSVICVGLIYNTPFPYSTEVGGKQKAVGSKRQSTEVDWSAAKPPPSPSGRGWAREAGPGEGEAEPVSNFQFPVSADFCGQDARTPWGWISRYAWGRDYHEIMRGKLEQLRGTIEELAPGAETLVYVDTGPVIERAFARFSGLGWMGKNTCIINEEKGSWLFLGVILTSLELEPDMPAPDRCGTCRACLDACPTGALVEPYVMDASKCISYLTIELKGSIPGELRPGMGVNIFGCDICQDACPWNGGGQESEVTSQEDAFRPMMVNVGRVGNQLPAEDKGQGTKDETQASRQREVLRQQSADGRRSSIQNPKSRIQNPPSPQHTVPSTFSLFAPPLDSLAAMTEEAFRKTFAHSPIKRTKYRGWLRNLCVAMGNSGDARFGPKLRELAQHPDPIVREHAEWALERFREG